MLALGVEMNRGISIAIKFGSRRGAECLAADNMYLRERGVRRAKQSTATTLGKGFLYVSIGHVLLRLLTIIIVHMSSMFSSLSVIKFIFDNPQ